MARDRARPPPASRAAGPDDRATGSSCRTWDAAGILYHRAARASPRRPAHDTLTRGRAMAERVDERDAVPRHRRAGGQPGQEVVQIVRRQNIAQEERARVRPSLDDVADGPERAPAGLDRLDPAAHAGERLVPRQD